MAKTDYDRFIDITAQIIIEIAEREALEQQEQQTKQSA
jgi:hypothetical protein